MEQFDARRIAKVTQQAGNANIVVVGQEIRLHTFDIGHMYGCAICATFSALSQYTVHFDLLLKSNG